MMIYDFAIQHGEGQDQLTVGTDVIPLAAYQGRVVGAFEWHCPGTPPEILLLIVATDSELTIVNGHTEYESNQGAMFKPLSGPARTSGKIDSPCQARCKLLRGEESSPPSISMATAVVVSVNFSERSISLVMTLLLDTGESTDVPLTMSVLPPGICTITMGALECAPSETLSP